MNAIVVLLITFMSFHLLSILIIGANIRIRKHNTKQKAFFLFCIVDCNATILLCKLARLSLTCSLSLAFAVSLTLGADVVAKHSSEDEVLFGSQLIQRTGNEQTDGIKTLLATKVDVDILLASRLHHVVNGLAVQPVGGKCLETAVAGEENHPAHPFLIFIDVIHQHPHLGRKYLLPRCLSFCRLLHNGQWSMNFKGLEKSRLPMHRCGHPSCRPRSHRQVAVPRTCRSQRPQSRRKCSRRC